MKKYNNKMDNGYLKIILGCMYAGKTSKLINIYNMMKLSNISTMVINYKDNRYDANLLSTHDKKMIPCVKTLNLMDIVGDVEPSEKVIIINETIFSRFRKICENMLSRKKHIYVCGLDGDYQMKKFGQILDIIPLCNEVEKLSAYALCVKMEQSVFYTPITNEKDQKVIGAENYMPVCRNCHLLY